MNKSEASRAVATIRMAYPKYYKDMTKEELEGVINLWAFQFKDMNGTEVLYALHDYISNDVKGFPPAIGQIKDVVYKRHNVNSKSALEAWEDVIKSIRKGGTLKEKYNRLDEVTQRTIGTKEELNEICMASIEYQLPRLKQDFLRRYELNMQKKMEYEKLPSSVKNVIDSINVKKIDSGKERMIEHEDK